jgi:hypothetical protein
MAIQFFTDRIKVGDFTLFEGNGGVQFDGVARAENFKGGAGTFQGSVSGYMSGGQTPPSVNTIDKFPFSTDSNGTDVGNLTNTKNSSVGNSSSTYGYDSASGGHRTTVDKFPFASDTNSVSFTGLTVAAQNRAGQSSFTHGYVTGGYVAAPVHPSNRTNTIEKFSFAQDVTGSDIGDITNGVMDATGNSSDINGYTSGGTGVASINTIDKFPFSADSNATDVGDLTVAKRRASGQSSVTHGYFSGGITTPEGAPAPTAQTNVIEKFPFSTNTNATDVGDLLTVGMYLTGQSSIVSGYSTGGGAPFPASNVIQKFPFATNSNATDVGDLFQARFQSAGQQH